MHLPRELIDEIICYLPIDEPQTLRNCSLVAKSWVHRSQKRLFETVTINKSTHSSWVDRILPGNIELLHHVRSLTYTVCGIVQLRYPTCRIDSLSDYLPSFRNLESLTLSSMDLRSDISQQLENFSTFQHTLSSLSLRSCHMSSGTLVTIVNYFPSLADLQLRAPVRAVDLEPIPALTRPLRGRLCFQGIGSRQLQILHPLSDLPPELDELVVAARFSTSGAYDHLVTTYAGNVKRLRLLRGFRPMNDPILSHCRKLRELELFAIRPAHVAGVIASITSTNLRRIVFSTKAFTERLAHLDLVRSCDIIDNSLCQLVDRLRESGYHRILEVEFQASKLVEWVVASDFKKLLVKFQEKGQVRIVQM